MLTNCLAACAHLTITVFEIDWDIGRKSSIFHTPFYSMPPLGGGFPSEYRHPIWYGKTRMLWLPGGEKNLKISLFVFAQLRTWRTQHDGIYRAYAYASRGKNDTSALSVLFKCSAHYSKTMKTAKQADSICHCKHTACEKLLTWLCVEINMSIL